MTSNVGARLITEKAKMALGFGSSDSDANSDYESIKTKVLGELKDVMRPELINRIDEIIVFRKLSSEDIEKIAEIMLSSLKQRLANMGHQITFTSNLVAHLAEAGYDEVYGARPLRRAIQSEVEDFLADAILNGEVKDGAEVTVDYQDGKVIIK